MSTPPTPPPTLDYRSPRDDRPPNTIAQAIGFAVLTAALAVGLVFFLLLVGFGISYGHSDKSTEAGLVVFGGGGLFLVITNWMAYRAYRNPRRRGIALGIWIGLGVAALFEGICFGSMR